MEEIEGFFNGVEAEAAQNEAAQAQAGQDQDDEPLDLDSEQINKLIWNEAAQDATAQDADSDMGEEADNAAENLLMMEEYDPSAPGPAIGSANYPSTAPAPLKRGATGSKNVPLGKRASGNPSRSRR